MREKHRSHCNREIERCFKMVYTTNLLQPQASTLSDGCNVTEDCLRSEALTGLYCRLNRMKHRFASRISRHRSFGTFLSASLNWLYMATCISIWIGITFLISAPGCPRGYIGPGGIKGPKSLVNCTGGISGYIDRIILTESHMRRPKDLVETFGITHAFETHGILSTVTSCATVVTGLQIADIIRSKNENRRKLQNIFTTASVYMLFATLLTGGKLFSGGTIPMNKRLWTPTFVFVNGTVCYLIFGVIFYALSASSKRHRWTQVVINTLNFAGRNTLLFYVGGQALAAFLGPTSVLVVLVLAGYVLQHFDIFVTI